jgi:ubiquinone biosynthesis protein Coq4
VPYKGDDPGSALVARYQALSNLPKGILGRTFWEFYRKNGFAFPGQESALNERFATPHDSTHILSSYDTTPRGEILASTFTAGMHSQEPMAGHILPVIFSWHLGIKINDVAGAVAGALDPEKFWEAWTRGSEVKVDLFDKDWSFWAVIEETVDQLRKRYNILPASDALTKIGGPAP